MFKLIANKVMVFDWIAGSSQIISMRWKVEISAKAKFPGSFDEISRGKIAKPYV